MTAAARSVAAGADTPIWDELTRKYPAVGAGFGIPESGKKPTKPRRAQASRTEPEKGRAGDPPDRAATAPTAPTGKRPEGVAGMTPEAS